MTKNPPFAEQLMVPIVEREKWHPNFLRLHDHADPGDIASLLEWADGFEDRDGKFVHEFQTTFNSSFWELYLHALLREWKLTVDFSHASPDFVASSAPFGSLLLEAVVASNPQGGMPEWVGDANPQVPPVDFETAIDLATVRLSQAVTSKHEKWVRTYSKLPHCSAAPYIICVAPFEQPGSWRQGAVAMTRLLFGSERPVTIEDGEGTARVIGAESAGAVFKASGADVPLGIFRDPKFADVSAVFFNPLATWGKVQALAEGDDDNRLFSATRLIESAPISSRVAKKDYEESLVDGAHLFLNPHAARPLDPEPWKERGVAVHWLENGRLISDAPEGMLLVRRSEKWVSAGTLERNGVRPHPPPAGAKAHVRGKPADGVPFAGPSQVGLTDRVELILWKGWTIQVGRDMVDKDWNSIAKRGEHLSLQDFIDSQDDPWMGDFVASRQEAVENAKSHIETRQAL